MREAQLGAVAPRRQAPLRKEQVCGRKTLGALVCGKGELRNRALPRAGTLHRRAGREGQLPCPEVAAAQLRLPLPARKGEFAVGHLRSVINIEPHAVPFGEAAGSRVIEAGARGGNREIQFKEVIAASCGRVVQITGAGRQQAGLKPQHHPYGSFHHLHRYLHGSFEGQARGSIRRKASRRRRSGHRNGVAEVLPGRCPGCKDRALSRFCKSAPPTGRPEPFRRGWEEQEAIRGGRMREMRCRWRERPANSETGAREQKARAEARAEARGRSGTGTGLAACPGQAESVGADRVSWSRQGQSEQPVPDGSGSDDSY